MSKLPIQAYLLTLTLLLLCACGKQLPDALSDADLIRHNRAVGLMGQYRYQAALTELAGLVETNPGNLELLVDLSIATLNRQHEGDETIALELLNSVLEKSENDLRGHYLSGLLKLNAGMLEQARRHFERVVETDPQDPYANYYLALSLAQLDQPEAALGWFERTIGLDPHLRSGYYGAFQTLRKLGDATRAREMLIQFEKLAGNPQSRQAEFKYTRMGPKAEIRAFGPGKSRPADYPDGPLFEEPVLVLKIPDAGNLQQAPNITAADINNDDHLDLFISSQSGTGQPNTILLGLPDGGFKPGQDHALNQIPGINTALWGDIDNDGLLDVYLCRDGPNQYWRQSAPGTWEDASSPVTANDNWQTRDGALFDADHDGDLDIFLVNADGPNELLNNNLNGSFRPLAATAGIQGPGAGSRTVLLADLDLDRDTDILVINDNGGHEVYLNDLLWHYRAAPGFDDFIQTPVVTALSADRDADGIPEIYTLSDLGQVGRWQPDAKDIWRQVPLTRQADPEPGGNAQMAILDINGDGASELVHSTAPGWRVYQFKGDQLVSLTTRGRSALSHWLPLNNRVSAGPAIAGLSDQGDLLYWPPGQGRHTFMGLHFSGKKEEEHSMRSNASGIGTRAAVRVADRWSVFSAFRQSTGPGQSLQPYTVGLGGASQADFISLVWSDGVFQTELNVAAGELHDISETQRQLASCPVLFAWDGQTYRFVSDILGVGGLGFETGYGEYTTPRPWENLQIPDGLLQTREGRYLFSLGEPMEETAYLDHARLMAYDLPPGWQLVLDERSAILGPQATGQTRFYRDELLPTSAVNERGQDVTTSITAADLVAAPLAMPDPRFIGRLQKEQVLTLEFDQSLDGREGHAMLIINGWIEYPYSQTMFAAWQAGADFQAPSLDALGEEGTWVTLMEQFGYPAGMPRRMSVPLGSLPKGTIKLRLRTNQEIYWDRISVAYAESPPDMERHSYPFEFAKVRNNGFPDRTTGKQRQPQYDYDRSAPFWDTRHMSGFYTEFGDVTELVAVQDDGLAIIGPGEEIIMAFKDTTGPVRKNWSRTFVFESFGWAKDMDLYTRDGSTVHPLPSSGRDPGGPERLHRKYNTRFQSGN